MYEEVGSPCRSTMVAHAHLDHSHHAAQDWNPPLLVREVRGNHASTPGRFSLAIFAGPPVLRCQARSGRAGSHFSNDREASTMDIRQPLLEAVIDSQL